MKKYEKVFIQEDQSRALELNSALMNERREIAQRFLTFSRQRRREYSEYKRLRVLLRDGYDSDDESLSEVTRVFKEKILSTEKIIL